MKAVSMQTVQLVRQVSSPVGTVILKAQAGALVGLALGGREMSLNTSSASAGIVVRESDGSSASFASREVGAPRQDVSLLDDVASQLGRYFGGSLLSFEVNIDPPGTEFQRRVWTALREIPYGETRSYAEIAAAVGQPKAARAVGMANNRNPIALIIPCHRVVGADGSLTGYAAGLDVKQALLNLERSERRDGPQAATSQVSTLAPG